jgi:hypothetical protein
VGAGEFHDQRPTATAAAAEAAATATESAAATAAEIASASTAAARNPTTFSAWSSSFRRRTAPRAFVIENARESDSDDHCTDDNFSHDAEMSLVPPINSAD